MKSRLIRLIAIIAGAYFSVYLFTCFVGYTDYYLVNSGKAPLFASPKTPMQQLGASSDYYGCGYRIVFVRFAGKTKAGESLVPADFQSYGTWLEFKWTWAFPPIGAFRHALTEGVKLPMK